MTDTTVGEIYGHNKMGGPFDWVSRPLTEEERKGGFTVTDDPVNHPAHYNRGIEVLDFIEAYELDYADGQVIKYVARARFKGDYLQDLKKAQFYLNRKIELTEKEIAEAKRGACRSSTESGETQPNKN